MNLVVVVALTGVISFGSGFVAALATRRYGAVLAVGALVVLSLYVLYVLTVGEGAPFAPGIVVWGAVGSVVLVAELMLGIGAARLVNRNVNPC